MIFLRDGEMIYFDYKGHGFDLSQIIDQYDLLNMLGEGGFGRVYRARHRETGELVAIKFMDITDYCKPKV